MPHYREKGAIMGVINNHTQHIQNELTLKLLLKWSSAIFSKQQHSAIQIIKAARSAKNTTSWNLQILPVLNIQHEGPNYHL